MNHIAFLFILTFYLLGGLWLVLDEFLFTGVTILFLAKLSSAITSVFQGLYENLEYRLLYMFSALHYCSCGRPSCKSFLGCVIGLLVNNCITYHFVVVSHTELCSACYLLCFL